MQTHSFSIYDASAGSGKTYSLVKEYLKIILSSPKNDAYKNILAITFTNKAVHEMKSRIVDSLSEFASDTPSEKAQNLMLDLSISIPLPITTIRVKAQQIIKHLIHNYAAFDISTIDKFTHRVIRAFAYDLNLPMTFEVTLDTKNLLIEAVDAIISQAGEDKVLTDLLIDFTMEKTDDDKSWDIAHDIFETSKLLLNENNRLEINHFQDKSIVEFIKIKDTIEQIISRKKEETVVLADNLFSLIDKNGVDLKSFSRGTLPNHIAKIRSGEFNPKNKMFRVAEDIQILKAAKDKAIIEAIIPEILILLGAIYTLFEKIHFYEAFLKNITPLSLLNTVSNELTKIQKEQNVLSISEFNTIIYNEIQNQPALFIYERLGERYRHFFIDEFQDTSEMQWQNLIPLINNALSGQDDYGNKGTLMIVGDPKQSIYRWRGGKAEQFIELSKDKNPFSNPDKQLFHLETNYRSYSEIIIFNNSFFKFLATEFDHPDYKELYDNHSSQKINDKIGGYINLSFISEDDDIDKTEKYGTATLTTIYKLIAQGFNHTDIVVLTRKRNQGIAIAKYLTEKDIPILSSETLMIQNSTEVQFIIHLLKYIRNNDNLEAKSYWLYFVAQNFISQIPVHDFISKGKELVNETEFENWLSLFGISLSFRNIRKKSLYEIVEIIVSTFLNTVQKGNAYVQYFLDIVLERNLRIQEGINDFLDFWDINAETFSIPSPEGRDAIRIMTIHKSKGLEFPVVIIPFAEEDYSLKPKDKLWLDADEESIGLPKFLINNNSAAENFGTKASEIYNLKKQEEMLDNINILYVALTRAEEQLYIISNRNLSSKGEIPKNNMSSLFLNYLDHTSKYDENTMEYEFGSPIKVSNPKTHLDTSRTIPVISNVLNPKNIKIAQRESLMWGTPQQEAIEYGNMIHEILAFIKTHNDIDLAIAKAFEESWITTNNKEMVYQTVQNIVNHPDLEAYFSSENTILNEQTIIQKGKGIIKPDKIVIKNDNTVLLLDYKTGVPNLKHKSQIENYGITMEEMGYKVTEKILFYINETETIIRVA